MSQQGQLLESARRAYGERDWPTARDRYQQAATHGDLSAADRRNLADTAWWLGLTDDAIADFEAAALQHHKDGQPQEAAMAATEAAISYFLRGEEAIGSAWVGRAIRWLNGQPECLASGWLALLTQVEAQIARENLEDALAATHEVTRIGRECGDNTLVAMAIACQGRIAVKRGHVEAGMGLLDEALLMAMEEGFDPAAAGNIYCHMMSTCYELGDLQRMDQWVEQTKAWCDALPAAVLFRGICRVHQAQLLGIHGAWAQAEAEALRVCEELAEISVSNVAEAQYSLGEVRRLRGDFDSAERAYREAHQRGRDPQPGLALLRLSQGRIEEAAASIRTSLSTCTSTLMRARLLFAQCEIALAAGDTETSASDVAELTQIAQHYGTAGLRAMSLTAASCSQRCARIGLRASTAARRLRCITSPAGLFSSSLSASANHAAPPSISPRSSS